MYLNNLDGLPSQGQGDGWILRLALKIILGPMTDHVFISEVDAFVHAVLSKAEEHVPYRELVGTTESLAL